MSTKIQKKLNILMHPILKEIELKKQIKQNSRNSKQPENPCFISSTQKSNMTSSIESKDSNISNSKFNPTKHEKSGLKKEYSFISFNNDKILSEIQEIKNTFLNNTNTTSPSTSSNGFYNKQHQPQKSRTLSYDSNINNSYNQVFTPKKRPFKTIFKSYDKQDKARVFFTQKCPKKHYDMNEVNNNQESSLVIPFNHDNDLDYVAFMKDMSRWKDQKISEWKDVYLDY